MKIVSLIYLRNVEKWDDIYKCLLYLISRFVPFEKTKNNGLKQSIDVLHPPLTYKSQASESPAGQYWVKTAVQTGDNLEWIYVKPNMQINHQSVYVKLIVDKDMNASMSLGTNFKHLNELGLDAKIK